MIGASERPGSAGDMVLRNLDVLRAADVLSNYRKILERTEERAPDAAIAGVTIQPMVTMEEGVELILGSKQGPTFR